jgi:hypothetical protein
MFAESWDKREVTFDGGGSGIGANEKAATDLVLVEPGFQRPLSAQRLDFLRGKPIEARHSIYLITHINRTRIKPRNWEAGRSIRTPI